MPQISDAPRPTPWLGLTLALLGALILTRLAAAGEVPVEPPGPDRPDDGRIEGVVPPADMPDPERWRFIPASRMPEGNCLELYAPNA